MKIITDLKTIQKLAKRRERVNWEFRAFLKNVEMSSREIDSMVHRLNQQVTAQIDCTECANCCRTCLPILSKKDILYFSQGLGIPVSDFEKQFVIVFGADKEKQFNNLPCPFLSGNLCRNYEHRPTDCRSFPHLHKKDFIFRTIGIVSNIEVCPIIFNVYELLKCELGDEFRNFRFNFDY